jgi:hypothetical protein
VPVSGKRFVADLIERQSPMVSASNVGTAPVMLYKQMSCEQMNLAFQG